LLMGFGAEAARVALSRTGGNVDGAGTNATTGGALTIYAAPRQLRVIGP
jgi:hypothetical protein